MAEQVAAPSSPPPYGYPAGATAPAKKRRWWLWMVVSLLLVSLLMVGAVVGTRTVSRLREEASQIGGATLPVPGESYPGDIEVAVKRQGSCSVALTNAIQAEVDLSCLTAELTPKGEFGANFLAYDSEVRIGEGVTGDVVNGTPRTAYAFGYALVTTDVAGHAGEAGVSCADGACVLRSRVELSAELDRGEISAAGVLDLGMGAMSVVKLDQGETVSVQAGSGSLGVSGGDLDNLRDHLFVVAYTGITEEGASGPRLTAIATHAFGSGELEPEQFFAAVRAGDR